MARLQAHRAPALRVRPILGACIALGVALAAWAPTPAAALPALSPTPSQAQASDLAEEEGEGEELEVDGEWVELEQEETYGDPEEDPSSLPPECLLRTVQPEVVVDPAHEKLRLTIRYTSRSPTGVDLGLRLRGGKGSLQLRSTRRQLTRGGVLRLGRHLDPGALAKARAAHVVLIQLDVPAAPAFCRSFLTMRLTAKRSLGDRATWSLPAHQRRA